MARGRRPKPVEVAIADGNPGRRPLPEPIPGEKLEATPPAGLNEAGRDLWTELVEQLGAIGALHAIDRAGLTALCIQWDIAEEARKVVEEEGYFAVGSMGQVVPNPALAIMRAAHDRLLRYIGEYGATPVARARVAAARSKVEQQNEFEAITAGDPVEIDDGGEVDADAL
jgi:P27 family predicted phage terminase small subunit